VKGVAEMHQGEKEGQRIDLLPNWKTAGSQEKLSKKEGRETDISWTLEKPKSLCESRGKERWSNCS